MSRVAVIGAGYVGLTTAACLADLGNDVIVVDIDADKIEQLKRHHVPFYEPGLSEHEKHLFARSLAASPDERWRLHENFLRSHDLYTRSARKKYGFK